MEYLQINWWLILLLDLIGFLILRIGISSLGKNRELIKALGTVILTASFIVMFIAYGLLSIVFQFLIHIILITPIVMFLHKLIIKDRKLTKYQETILKTAEESGEEIERIKELNPPTFKEWLEEKKTKRHDSKH